MKLKLTSKTKLYCSFAAKPGNFGNYFHNYLFQNYGIDSLYKSLEIKSANEIIEVMKLMKIPGAAVAMPFKEDVINFLDEISNSSKEIGAINTVIESNGKFIGHNTDFLAAQSIINEFKIEDDVFVLGAGGVAKAVVHALYENGYKKVTIANRSKEKAITLANKYDYKVAELYAAQKVFINCTSIGMNDDSEVIDLSKTDVSVYWDLVVKEKTGTSRTNPKVEFINGIDFAKRQALEQFKFYTGESPNEELIDSAFMYAKNKKSLSVSLTERYFDAFGKKNLDSLSKMFNKDATLIDKNVESTISTKEEMLIFLEGVFKAVGNIKFLKTEIFELSMNETLSKLELDIDGNIVKVIDHITFKNGLISEVRAYFDS